MSSNTPRRGLPVVGTLGELFPSLTTAPEAIPAAPVHPRVLVGGDASRRELVFVCWEDPGSPKALHDRLRRLVEATLLAELCRPPRELLEPAPPITALTFLVFAELEGDIDAAVRAFGFERVTPTVEALASAMSHVRGEALAVDRPPPEAPTAVFQAKVSLAPGERGITLLALEAALVQALSEQVWGEHPGAFLAALDTVSHERALPPLPPSGEGIDELERRAIHYTPGVVRMIPPLVFQALCDMVGVVATHEHGRKIDWAPADLDDDGLPSPPLLRVRSRDGFIHLPIALHLLRWCVMPLAAGEVVPTVSDWVLDQFAS